MGRRTKAERRLIEFVGREFGEHLGALLLSGLGESPAAGRRAFAVTITDRLGSAEQYSLEMSADGESTLPFGKDPLVLAAHLRMLRDQGAASRLVYCFPDVLRVLGWRDPIRDAGVVEGALIRYYRSSYSQVRRRRHPLAQASVGRTAEQRLVDGYDFEDEPLRSYKDYSAVYTVVDFNPQFLDQLRRRALFGIDWNLVTAVKARAWG